MHHLAITQITNLYHVSFDHAVSVIGWDYPMHLGVTEAGEGEDGRMKSAIGIGSLLADGLGVYHVICYGCHCDCDCAVK